jgi:L-glyceraldehyde 3-phosphate reductase
MVRPKFEATPILAGDFTWHRDELIITTKAGHLMWGGPYGESGSRKHMLASLDQSLRRLRLSYVDVFYLPSCA